jgi:hypothetical protein
MTSRRLTRRRIVRLGAAATALPLVHIRTAGSAGVLNVGFWDHWVPRGTEVMRRQVMTWADKNKVEVHADFITSQGDKLTLTAAAEAQAQIGHDSSRSSNGTCFNMRTASSQWTKSSTI